MTEGVHFLELPLYYCVFRQRTGRLISHPVFFKHKGKSILPAINWPDMTKAATFEEGTVAGLSLRFQVAG